MCALSLSSLSLSFEAAVFSYGAKPVLSGVNGQVHAGQALALVGPNGSGKTTLLRAMLGLVRVSAGHVDVLGHAPGRAPRGSIGYVPQLSELDQTFPVTVLDVVQMGLYSKLGMFRRVGASGRARALDALKQVGLADRADWRFGTLSGGQQQRVLVARCIVSQPKLLLLDEPFNGLDQPNREALLEIIAEVKASGVIVVVSTHDLVLAREACELVALLGGGHQVAFGRKGDVLQASLLDQAYGGHNDQVHRLSAQSADSAPAVYQTPVSDRLSLTDQAAVADHVVAASSSPPSTAPTPRTPGTPARAAGTPGTPAPAPTPPTPGTPSTVPRTPATTPATAVTAQ